MEHIGGNSDIKSDPIWKIAKRNNAKKKSLVIKYRGKVVKKYLGYSK